MTAAIEAIPPGGVIEVAPGAYRAPGSGFRIRNLHKSFTIRGMPGGEVVLTGEGSRRIVRYSEYGGHGLPVIFESLVFADGWSDSETHAGGVSVARGEAVFLGCSFRSNGSSLAGGALRIADGAHVTLLDSRFQSNTSARRGGAIEILYSSVQIWRSNFLENRTNPPGHAANANGGAIHALDSSVQVFESNFEGNQAGWVGGAIYGFGRWVEPQPSEATHILVQDSTFYGNRAATDPCCPRSVPTSGGAIHVEDQTLLSITRSTFTGNRASWGGAVSSYRAVVEAEDAVFRGNVAEPDATFGAGGAIILLSRDFADASTGFGAHNRRAARLDVRHSLLQGRFGTVSTTANQGGCILAGGDGARQLGNGDVEIDPDLGRNRARVRLKNVVLADCDVQQHPDAGPFGGAILALLADLEIEDSLIVHSDVVGEDGTGGGLAALQSSRVKISRTTFAENVAGLRGGAAAIVGGEVRISDSGFFRNEISPGVAERIHDSLGAGLYMSVSFSDNPNEPLRDITGVVEDSAFLDNVGLPIRDVQSSSGPPNRVVYDGNRFRSAVFGPKVYLNTAHRFAGETVAELNALILNGEPKSAVPNRIVTAPREGQLVAAPRQGSLRTPQGARTAIVPGLWWASAGAPPEINGTALDDEVGSIEGVDPARYELGVGGLAVASAVIAPPSCSSEAQLCLSDRFSATVSWADRARRTGVGRVVPFQTRDSGLFYFFDPDNWEMLVKVLDGCELNDHFWVFSAATTNVEYAFRVTDTLTGRNRLYTNSLGRTAPALVDTLALPVCDVEGRAAEPHFGSTPQSRSTLRRAAMPGPLVARDSPGSSGLVASGWDSTAELQPRADCSPGSETLCLERGRFRLEIEWRDHSGRTGRGEVVPFQSDDSGLFYFFHSDNWEMLVKVLDGCGLNDRFWVFHAATTDVEFLLRVADTVAGVTREYRNPLGMPAQTVLDTSAFSTCGES